MWLLIIFVDIVATKKEMECFTKFIYLRWREIIGRAQFLLASRLFNAVELPHLVTLQWTLKCQRVWFPNSYCNLKQPKLRVYLFVLPPLYTLYTYLYPFTRATNLPISFRECVCVCLVLLFRFSIMIDFELFGNFLTKSVGTLSARN